MNRAATDRRWDIYGLMILFEEVSFPVLERFRRFAAGGPRRSQMSKSIHHPTNMADIILVHQGIGYFYKRL
jgi:hypothetical protein